MIVLLILYLKIATILFCAASHVYEPLVVSTCEAWVTQCRGAVTTSSWTTNNLGSSSYFSSIYF